MLVICLTLVTISSGCDLTYEPPGPIDIPESRLGLKSEFTLPPVSVNTVKVFYKFDTEVLSEELDFAPQGLIRGLNSVLVPADCESITKLGIFGEVSINGNTALLSYNEQTLLFEADNFTVYRNNKEALNLTESPTYNNGTLYVPLYDILEILQIDYRVEYETLIIGERYVNV